jgi:hypothetical protein
MTLEEEIHRRAINFCRDNAFLKRHQQIIETAMLIGASIILEQGPAPIPGESEEGWKQVEEVFEAYYKEKETPDNIIPINFCR